MFVDLVGSTALGQRLDPEDLREVMRTFLAHVTSLVACFHGFVAHYMGDGALVYFGYPQAHEADAERAIRAGLIISEAVPRLNTRAGPPGTLSVRVGIATGIVVVGDLIGFGSSREASIVGDTPNLAARLQSAAEPGTVIISDDTRLLVGDLFEYRELTLSNLKGRSGAERAWIVIGESVVENRYQALRLGKLSLVNRTEELELLLRRWDQAKIGEGRVVFLTGEPGIGKSRLVAAFEQYTGCNPQQYLRFFCSPLHLDTPLYPIVRHIEHVAKVQRGDSAAAKLDKLANMLPPDAPAEDKALFAELLSIRLSDSDFLETLTPQRRKVMTFAAIVRHIHNFARQRATVLIVEDMHWADPTSLEVLNLLVDAAQQLPLLLLITARPETRPTWSSRSHVTVRVLSGLDDRYATRLIEQVAGERELPQDIIARIISHADSVPLFIEEITKTVIASWTGKQGHAFPAGKLSVDVVPASLYSSLMARLDRLMLGKEAARVASVIGREFSLDLLQAVSEMPPKQLEDALAELAHAEIIVAGHHSTFVSYMFRHALVQDAAYASLLRDQRRAIHRRLAEVLETGSFGETAEPHVIAWHFAEAGVPERSAHYYKQAAEHPKGRFALAEMVHHFRNALIQITNIADSIDRRHSELALQLELGRALIDHEGANSDAVRETFERALELCLDLNEVQFLPRVYDGLVVNYYFIRSQPEKILQYTRDLETLHQRLEERRALFMKRRAECLANLLLGHFEAARRGMQRLLDMYDLEHDGPNARMSTRDPKASTCVLLAICLTILGHADAGTSKSACAVQHAEALGHAVSLNLALRRSCAQAMLQKDVGRVIELADRMASLRAAYETYKGSWEGTFFHDWAQMCTRPDPVVFDRVQVFMHHLDVGKNWALLPLYIVSTVELVDQSGDTARAVVLLGRAAEIINVTGSRWFEAEVIRLRARFCTNPEEAMSLLRLSLAIAREQGAKLWEVRAATDLARLLHDRKNSCAARDVLAPVYSWFTEGLEMPDVRAARALLHNIEHG